jgi:hypothetical protein
MPSVTYRFFEILLEKKNISSKQKLSNSCMGITSSMFWWYSKSEEPESELTVDSEPPSPPSSSNQYFVLLDGGEILGVFSSRRMAELARSKLARVRYQFDWPLEVDEPNISLPLKIVASELDELK